MINNSLIIMTGTISPNKNVYCLKLNDYKERLSQYIESLNYLIEEEVVKKIIFCDNSNFVFDTSQLKQKAKNHNIEIEFLFFKGNDKLVEVHGKGAGEFEIMKFIFQNSILINTVETFMKITGRIKILNLKKIINKCKENCNYFQCHYPKNKKRYVETVFYKLNIEDFKKFSNVEYLVDDSNGIYYEHIIYNQLLKNKIKFSYFPLYPIKEGISGSTGGEYNEKGKLFIIKCLLANVKLLRLYYYFSKK